MGPLSKLSGARMSLGASQWIYDDLEGHSTLNPGVAVVRDPAIGF